MVYNQIHIDLLKQVVVKKFGRPIVTHKDSQELANFIRVQNVPVSSQTIRRIFGLIKYDSKPSLEVLNAFANYVGYDHFNHFLSDNLESQLDFLFSEKAETQDYWDACEKLSYELLSSPEMVAICQEKLTKLPLARDYFIENHPLRDLICTGYAMYFQEYLKYKYTLESRLFAYGFLFIGAFLSENRPFIDIYYQQMENTPITYPPNGVFHLPAARKFGVPLLHAWLYRDEKRFREKFNEMLKVRPMYEYSSKYHAFSFDQEIVEHLALTDRFEEMRYIVDTTLAQVNPDTTASSRQTSQHETWKILKAYVYLNTGEKTLAENYFKAVNLSLINPGWQKYYTILYHFVGYYFCSSRQKKETIKKIEELINETHFTFYYQLLETLK
ncbi:hypothetical protein MT996_02755 [Ornithobacterium rhinotracheale]|uniref:hypothetical protein n=1 Tax=Ornithobacterium rhinotracheale TaxID=28251 RepID=UPI001FBB054F|nr:hypothetical protein [Ornithobacterium rhinotracheale]UOH78397.1 hypothetical protein MT996_02755 [Ornithobacterium rhinotracheale]